MDTYDPHAIEKKWQQVWEAERAFSVPDPEPGAPRAEKFYMLEMLPYPSGNNLHMGHVLNYTLGDVVTHFRRRNGLHVLRPMGFDSFGLPAENAAIKEGAHPRVSTERNIVSIRRSMKRLGWAIDWARVLAMQRHWIGRSHGAEILFDVPDLGERIPVFTTRPDTLFGATFFVLAPEHPLVPELVAGTTHELEVLEYVRHATARS